MNGHASSAHYQLVVVRTAPRLSLDSFASRAGLHPDFVRRLVALGLVSATPGGTGQLWFVPAELATVARIRRLRADLSINYAALGLVLDLLDRIDALEHPAAATTRRQPSWI